MRTKRRSPPTTRSGRSRDRLLTVRAGVRAVELRLRTGRIDAGAAADEVERLAFIWRGDARELVLRLRVAELRAEAAQWRAALSGLREAEALFPDQKALIRSRQREVFAAMLEDRNADRLAPLELVSLVEENADLVPEGKPGEALASRVADRLLALDLPEAGERRA